MKQFVVPILAWSLFAYVSLPFMWELIRGEPAPVPTEARPKETQTSVATTRSPENLLPLLPGRSPQADALVRAANQAIHEAQTATNNVARLYSEYLQADDDGAPGGKLDRAVDAAQAQVEQLEHNGYPATGEAVKEAQAAVENAVQNEARNRLLAKALWESMSRVQWVQAQAEDRAQAAIATTLENTTNPITPNLKTNPPAN